MPFGWASASSLAAILTPSPRRFSSLSTTGPELMPILKSSWIASALDLLLLAIFVWN